MTSKSRAAQHRANAAEAEQKKADSFDRCDTDGFVSQWAHGITGQLERTKAELAEAGDVATFPGLFVAETGERVRAKLIETRYGWSWAMVDEAGKFTGQFLNDSKGTKRSKMGKLGLEKRDELAPAAACLKGSGTGLSGACSVFVKVFRTDDGYPADAVSFDLGA